MFRVHLSFSDVEVMLRAPTGIEDLMLLEARFDDTLESELGLAVAIAERLATAADGVAAPDWHDMPAMALDILLLRIRQMTIGDRIRGNVPCPSPDCGEPVQIDFGIEAFLRHAVRESQGKPVPDASGWFTMPAGAEVIRFRLPTPRDLREATCSATPERALAQRCIQPETATAAERRRVARALESIAPLGVRELTGHCPACAAAVAAEFDIRRFCLRELRDLANFLYSDVDALARVYHWSEASILALRSDRRAHYAERARHVPVAL